MIDETGFCPFIQPTSKTGTPGGWEIEGKRKRIIPGVIQSELCNSALGFFHFWLVVGPATGRSPDAASFGPRQRHHEAMNTRASDPARRRWFGRLRYSKSPK